MEGGLLSMGIERKSSLESEPRTLNLSQIQYAREAALYVMSTRSMEEAMSIFTEGLEPVTHGVQSGGSSMDLEEELSCYQPDRIRDIASAPF